MQKRLEEVISYFLTHLEGCCRGMAIIIGEICFEKKAALPVNLTIVTRILEHETIDKKNLNNKQWKHLADTKITEK